MPHTILRTVGRLASPPEPLKHPTPGWKWIAAAIGGVLFAALLWLVWLG